MISEQQAEALLDECETAIGTPLTDLRKRLARDCKSYSHLWELITLYCTLPLGSIEHEAGPSNPDICINHGDDSPLWIEATYIYSKEQQEIDNATDFIRWILKQLQSEGVPCAKSIHVDIKPHDRSNDISIPIQNQCVKGGVKV